jgi:arginase family enzyme
MTTKPITAIVFPFDLFGNAGTGNGARLLADMLYELLEDTARETRSIRTRAIAERLEIQECPFDTLSHFKSWRKTGHTFAARALNNSRFCLWLAGNHLGVLPVFETLGRQTLVLQFDAHLDCYDLDCTHATLSHGNWLLHCQPPGPKIIALGHRDLFLTERQKKAVFEACYPIETIAESLESVLKALKAQVESAERLWIDLDLDVLDPAYAPGVQMPMPFGLNPQQLLRMICELWSDKVVGMSLSEFDPGRDQQDRTLELLGWLIERIFLRVVEEVAGE